MTPRLHIWGVDGLPEVEPGHDLGELLTDAATDLRDGDVVVVTSKVVSKAEGRLVSGTREEHLAAESVRLVAARGDTRIVETRHGFVLAAAGIDASNVPAGSVALLPVDPDASARRIRDTVLRRIGIDVAVIVSDTMGRPWREGVIDTAIGSAGLDVLWDLRGRRDTAGHLLEATVIAVADELAGAADLVKGKLAGTPIAVIRGFPFTRSKPDPGARPLVRAAMDDMFRLGTREAKLQVVTDSAPLPGPPAQIHEDVTNVAGGTEHPTTSAVTDAVGSLGTVEVDVVIDDAGQTIAITGRPLSVGIAAGRLLAALAAVGLRAAISASSDDVSPTTATLRVIAP
jgi:coenzyme F420-0:L-glutamate ligase